MKKSQISRRNFLGKAVSAGVAGAVMPSFIAGCAADGKKNVVVPVMLDKAPDGPMLKAGVIGCGDRASGAAEQWMTAGPNVTITALGDLFPDKMGSYRNYLKEKTGVEVADENCFLGFDAYQKVIDSGVDVVIIATPPVFRPLHFAAAVEAKKHVFMEKPVAVDPEGARQIMASARKAQALGLSVVTGTQRRHQRDYVATWAEIAGGSIGEIVSANCYWNQGKLWHVNPKAEWSEMEAMIRNWVNWTWVSGDHIVEQHVHNIDVINWFTGSHPVKAVGFGSRLRRVTGDCYDNFSVDYTFENGMHLHSMSRQINGCANNVSEYIRGEKGWSNCRNTIWDDKGNEVWKYEYPLGEDGKPTNSPIVNPYWQEHIDLLTAIRTNNPINEAENTAISTLVGIMGRISAYTGKEVTWEEMMNSDLKLGPKVFVMGPANVPTDIPVAGEAFVPKS